MKGCLSERALVMLSVGEAEPEERSHLDSCARCAGRRREIVRDLDAIREGLRVLPASQPARVDSWLGLRVRHLAPALAAAGLAIVIGGGWWIGARPTEVARSTARPAMVALSDYAGEISAALSGGSGANSVPGIVYAGASTPSLPRIAEAADLQRALGAGSPCTGDRLFGADCNDYTDALFF